MPSRTNNKPPVSEPSTSQRATVSLDDVALFLPDFEAARADFEALTPEQVTNVNLDVVHAAAVAQAASKRCLTLRPAMAKIAEIDVARIDKISLYSKALMHVNSLILSRSTRVNALKGYADEGNKLRANLLSYAETLVQVGRFDADTIARIKDGVGYKELASDLSTLSQMFLAQPETLQSGIPVSVDNVRRAFELTQLISVALGERDDVDGSQQLLLDQRKRLSMLLQRAMAELRRAVTFLRWYENDAAEWVPSIFVGGRPNGAKVDAEPATPDVEPIAQPAKPVFPINTQPREERDPEDHPFDRSIR